VFDVPHGAVVEVAPSSTHFSESSQGKPMVRAEVEVESSDADKPTEGGEVAEGVDAGGTGEQTEDEAVSALAMEDPTSFATAFPKAIAAPGLETDERVPGRDLSDIGQLHPTGQRLFITIFVTPLLIR
jgi:hypothetical protein